MRPDARAIVKHLGRANARELPRDDAGALFTAMLNDHLDAAQLGAAWMALRIKGETQSELAAFLTAAEATYAHWPVPASGSMLPLLIPSYNGARQLPNLVPLLAHLLARAGVPVLVHGIWRDPARTPTREIFSAMGNHPCRDAREMAERQRAGLPAFVAIDALAPAVARLLDWRWRIGVRGSIHTIAKLLNPVAGQAVRLVSVTHPDYLAKMRTFFFDDPAGVLLLRGAEGEAVAHPRRALQMEFIRGGAVTIAAAAPNGGADTSDLPADCSAAVTATWIRAALDGVVPVPAPIAVQVKGCLLATRRQALPLLEVVE